MRPVTQIQKTIQNIDFLTSSIYEKYDLRGVIRPYERFIVRQGDLLITNRSIINFRERGLMRALLRQIGEYFVFEGSHVILPLNENTLIFHNEHGLVVIPTRFETLYFYTFRNASD